MMTFPTTLTRTPLTMNPQTDHAGFSKLFAAAVVSRSFCQLLLDNPEEALRQGYQGKQFNLNPQEAGLIISMNAKSLPELARQVVQTVGD
jgi:hypothetical protein